MTAREDNQGNPYAPPSSDLNLGTIPPLREGELAERGTRLVAQMMDGLLALLVLLPGMLEGFRSGAFRDSSNLAFFRNFGASGAGMFSGVAWIGLLLLQAYLVTIRGQSLAKGWLGIKIVKVDGSPVKFVSGVLLRHWLVLALQYVPGLNGAVALGDALFIFRKDRRCLHDLIAGTRVIQLKGAARIRLA
jgi:uncharacterized RDD family membrane protein YckC